MGSFVYAIISLFFMRHNIGDEGVISTAIGILLIVLCLGFFTFFIYHVTSSIKVENLIKKLYEEATTMIEDYKDNFDSNKFIHISNSEVNKPANPKEIIALQSGYIQVIDHKGLLEEAIKFNRLIQVTVKLGKFVIRGEKLANVYEGEGFLNKEDYEGIRGKFTIGDERTTLQDIVFSLEKLADIALRAISPGFNDPNTAKECINVIGLVIGDISRYTGDKILVRDGHDTPRLIMEGIGFKEVLYLTFYQLRHYGSEDISIVISNLEALTIAAYKAPIENRKVIWDFHKYIIENEEQKTIKEMDRLYLERVIYKLEKICNGK